MDSHRLVADDLDEHDSSAFTAHSAGISTLELKPAPVVKVKSSMSKIFDFSNEASYDQLLSNEEDLACGQLSSNEEALAERTATTKMTTMHATLMPSAWSSAARFETIGGIDGYEEDSSDYESDSSASLDSSEDDDDGSDSEEESNLHEEVGEASILGEASAEEERSRGGEVMSKRNSTSLSSAKKRKSETHQERKKRRGSVCEDKVFMRTNSAVKRDDFLNKLKSSSVKDLNKEFWENHKWYLTYVMCFVTLHVLYVTSFVLTEEDE
jgi:hypothetical protein